MSTTTFSPRVRLFLLLPFLVSLAWPAHAAPMIEVSTACDVKVMQALYGLRLNNSLDQLRFRILQHLQGRQRLGYWSFQPGSPGGGARRAAGPLLQFQITEPQNDQIQIQMAYSTPHSEYPTWNATWMEPGQSVVNGYPSNENLTDELFKVIQHKLLGLYEAPLRSLLIDTAPLATGGRWDGSSKAPRLILPLPWDRYSLLRQSQFRLECSWLPQTDDADGELISRATNLSGEFQETPQRKYRAIIVTPETWRLFDQTSPQPIKKFKKIRQLHPKRAYLYKEKTSGLGLEVIEEGT